LVVEHVAADDRVDAGDMQRRGVHGVGAALLDDAQFAALEGEGVLRAGVGPS
jgi:hypothetical protein